MPNPTNNKLVDSKTIAALFDMTPRRVQQLTKEGVIAAVKEGRRDFLRKALATASAAVAAPGLARAAFFRKHCRGFSAGSVRVLLQTRPTWR